MKDEGNKAELERDRERSKRRDPKGMRCSELYGNIERLTEKINPPVDYKM